MQKGLILYSTGGRIFIKQNTNEFLEQGDAITGSGTVDSVPVFTASGILSNSALISTSTQVTSSLPMRVVHQSSPASTANATVLTVDRNASSGTPAANFGSDIVLRLQSSTTTNRTALTLRTVWSSATDSTRAARSTIFIHDTAARTVLQLESDGTQAMIGFLGAAAVARQTGGALTAAATYGSNEQTMLNRVWTAARNFGLIT